MSSGGRGEKPRILGFFHCNRPGDQLALVGTCGFVFSPGASLPGSPGHWMRDGTRLICKTKMGYSEKSPDNDKDCPPGHWSRVISNIYSRLQPIDQPHVARKG